MLKDKELKAKQREVHQIEAAKSQREIIKAKLALTDCEADKLARDMAKNKLISSGGKMEQNTSILHRSHL